MQRHRRRLPGAPGQPQRGAASRRVEQRRIDAASADLNAREAAPQQRLAQHARRHEGRVGAGVEAAQVALDQRREPADAVVPRVLVETGAKVARRRHAEPQVRIEGDRHARRAPFGAAVGRPLAALAWPHQQHCMAGMAQTAGGALDGQRDAGDLRRIGLGDVDDLHRGYGQPGVVPAHRCHGSRGVNRRPAAERAAKPGAVKKA